MFPAPAPEEPTDMVTSPDWPASADPVEIKTDPDFLSVATPVANINEDEVTPSPVSTMTPPILPSMDSEESAWIKTSPARVPCPL